MILRSVYLIEVRRGNRSRFRSPRSGFSLVELMIVMAIVGILTVLALPSMQRISAAGSFNGNIGQISEILEQARAYANSQDTYVWVAFYPLDPSTITNDASGDQLYIATYASSDGTDPFSSWTGTYTIPYTVAGTNTTVGQIFKLTNLRQIRLVTQNYFTQTQVPSLPASMVNPTSPATQPVLSFKPATLATTLSTQPLPSGAQAPAISVIQFTPSGAAQVSSSLAPSVGLDFEPMKGAGVADSNNLVSMRINGLTGLTTIYRR